MIILAVDLKFLSEKHFNKSKYVSNQYCYSSASTTENVFKLPSGLKLRLCRMLDQVPNPGLNDWKALAATLRLESGYFQSRSSPTECILTLWEVQQHNHTQVNPIVDLLNLLRVIGRQDAAQMVEKDFGPWI